MKNLKINFGLFSLLAILAVSVFLTSCEQEVITDSIDDEITTTQQYFIGDESAASEDALGIILPQDITEKGEEAIKEYLENISDEQRASHINDYIIAEYLTRNKHTDIDMNEVLNFKDIGLSNYLSENELSELNAQLVSPSEVQSRACYKVYCYWYSYWSSWCGCWVDRYYHCGWICY